MIFLLQRPLLLAASRLRSATLTCIVPLAVLALAVSAHADTINYTDSPTPVTTPLTTTLADPLSLSISSGSAIQGGAIAGDGSITKIGNGTLSITGSNSYTGTTTIAAGILSAGSASAFGNGGAIEVSLGTLQWGSGNTTDYSNRFTAADNQRFRLDTNGNDVTLATGLTSLDGSFTKGGTGTLTLTGTSSFTTSAAFRPSIVGLGTVAVASGGSLFLDADLRVAGSNSEGSATLQIDSGGSVTGGEFALLKIGRTMGGSGTVSVNSGTLTFQSITVGESSGGFLDLTGGVVSDIVGVLGLSAAGFQTAQGFGYATVRGGSWINSESLTIGDRGIGTLEISGTGRVDAGAEAVLGKNEGSSGTLRMGNGGTLAQDAFVVSGSIEGGTGYAEVIFNHTGSYTFATKLTGSLLVAKEGAGTLSLSADSTYSGATLIYDGTLIVNGNNSEATGAVTVANNGTLGGSGIMGGAVTIEGGGAISPGNSPGTLTTGDETWNGDGAYQWELNAATGTAGTNWDYLDIDGALFILSSEETPFSIDVNSLTSGNVAGLTGGFVEGVTYTWTILTASGGITGFDADQFEIITNEFLNDAGTNSFSLAQLGNTLQLSYTAVPEPTTWAFLGLGLLAFTARRRGARLLKF